MRSGRLLAEEAPQVLLSIYGCQSLEEVFLKLSRKQQGTESNNLQEKQNNTTLVSIYPIHRKPPPNSIAFLSHHSSVFLNVSMFCYYTRVVYLIPIWIHPNTQLRIIFICFCVCKLIIRSVIFKKKKAGIAIIFVLL